ncbi:MAG: RDD family protein [Bacteroidota bacterium]|nr:RDD family protein [Bacteroidota bacterium]
MATIRVHTAQNVTLEYEVASLGDRIVATLIDYIILAAWGAAWLLLIFKTVSAAGSKPTNWNLHDPAILVAILLMFLIVSPYFFYNLFCEVFFNGQSIGKKARDIRVIRLDGTAPRLGDYLLRWLLRIVDMGPFNGLIAVLTIALNGKGQRLGDLAAGTTVVKLRRMAAQTVELPTLPAGYQVVFPQAALLADHDLALVRQLMQQAAARADYVLLNEVANKVKALTGIQTSLPDDPFLKTVLRDHAHLATHGSGY